MNSMDQDMDMPIQIETKEEYEESYTRGRYPESHDSFSKRKEAKQIKLPIPVR